MKEIAQVFGTDWLKNKLTLYIPSTVNVSESLTTDAAEAVITKAVRLLSETFGGATEVKATGSWLSSNGTLVSEPVTLVYCYAAQFSTGDLMKVKRFCEELKKELGQEAVALEINNRMIFI